MNDEGLSLEQLHFPNLEPDLTGRLGLGLLHWDSISRMVPPPPVPGSNDQAARPLTGVLAELEQAGLLVPVELIRDDILDAQKAFQKLMTSAILPATKSTNEKPLVTPRTSEEKTYFVHAQKSGVPLHDKYPDYFKMSEEKDRFFCSPTTGYTYGSFLAHFLRRRLQFPLTATDMPNSQSVLLSLKTFVEKRSEEEVDAGCQLRSKSSQLERTFFMPLFRVLSPSIFEGEVVFKKILSFRTTHDGLRKDYINRATRLAEALGNADSSEKVRDLVATERKELSRSLSLMAEACKGHGIPVHPKFVTYSPQRRWQWAARIWSAVEKTTSLIVENSPVFLIERLAKIPETLDYYQEEALNNPLFYPLLIQEAFAPTTQQTVFKKMAELHRISL